MACGWVWEAGFWWEGVEGEDPWVEEEGKLGGGHGFQLAHCVGAAVGGFVACFEGAGFGEAEYVHAEFF